MIDSDVDTTSDDGRDETPNERSDRNWSELMQEFRVLQTGTQIMAGFLLTLPFQQRFTELGPFDHVLYLCLVIFAVLVTLLALAPVMLHRILFGERAKAQLVHAASVILILCLIAASLLFVGIVLFVFDFVVSPTAGIWAGGAVAVLVLLLWTIGPKLLRNARDRAAHASPTPNASKT
ncbi:sodium:proton antiporter [Pseudoclavibacter sp. RFBG4]|uniref:DUF6328 family protein n=1 Tax=Pseudoclavibacter sp. RFBG4 TaxID=2080575 RepID=UPI000CE7C009|nr:DUF6328 family protein [Pseudoclavibacter sp. RFBG4]PPG27762.1 sodium:proton antiporter [Pseudoclavibacter sp. RFBG4]